MHVNARGYGTIVNAPINCDAHVKYTVLEDFGTIETSDYQTFGLLNFWTTEPSDQRAFGLLSLRIIEFSD